MLFTIPTWTETGPGLFHSVEFLDFIIDINDAARTLGEYVIHYKTVSRYNLTGKNLLKHNPLIQGNKSEITDIIFFVLDSSQTLEASDSQNVVSLNEATMINKCLCYIGQYLQALICLCVIN